MLTQIINGKIFTPNGWLEGGSIILSDSKILEIANSDLPRVGAAIVDVKGDYILPGFVAMNIHGGGGKAFKEGTREAFDIATDAHLKHGATTIFPTIYTAKTEKIYNSAKVCEEIMKEGGSPVKGIHVAGPYFNPNMVKSFPGAKDPDKEEYTKILSETNCIKRWDLSPELPGAYEMAKILKWKNIVAAITHTQAEFEIVKEAYDAGFTHVSQLYNAMPGFHKRGEYKYEGTVESVFLLDDMGVEVTADGRHLPATILRLVYKLKGVEHTSLVTNALKYAAFDGEVEADSDFIIEDGVCKLKDHSSLAGSIATMDKVVKVAADAGIPFEDVIRMATETPARVMNCFDRVGSLEEGKDADIVLMNKDLEITGVWSQGKKYV